VSRLVLGACLSLTGRYGRFGRQAADGLRAWQALRGDDVELRVEDDRSDPDRIAAGLGRLAAECDLLLGPYSTQLVREAGRVIAELDGLLWNHGGSGDDVQAACPGRIVSVLAPTSRYAAPFVRARAAERETAALWVVRGRGRFGLQVSSGAMREAEHLGIEAIERRKDQDHWLKDVPEVWDLFSAGVFEDDIAIVNEARLTARPPRVVCSIAAGVHDFASMVEDPDGIFGIAQWFPGRNQPVELGPSEQDFVAAYQRLAGGWPDYPAVQAAAGAVIAVHCAEIAGSLRTGALWAAAVELQITTLFGPFGVDPETGVQTSHTPVLTRWHGGEQQLAQ
jgi:ABC-type branched-subunit amino acid transport system substrate-binding protein